MSLEALLCTPCIRSCCAPRNHFNSLRATVFVRISMLMIHKSTASLSQTSHRRCRSVFQHVSITLLNGCVRIVFSWMQRRPRFSGQPPVAVCIRCRSHCSVLVPILLRPLPSSDPFTTYHSHYHGIIIHIHFASWPTLHFQFLEIGLLRAR